MNICLFMLIKINMELLTILQNKLVTFHDKEKSLYIVFKQHWEILKHISKQTIKQYQETINIYQNINN